MITSTSNAKVKDVIRLQKKAAYRKACGLYVVEGVRMFLEADRERIAAAYVSETFLEKPENCRLLEAVPYETVQDHVMKAMSDTVSPQGVLCVMRQANHDPAHIIRQKNPRLLLLNDLQDPGNAGTILRTAEAAGMDAVILSHGSVDFYNPKTIRSTMGAIYRVPFLYADLAVIIRQLQAQEIPVYTTDMQGFDYRKASYARGFALMIGNEAKGVDPALAKIADEALMIPMKGKTESLNAAVAAALLMYEACRNSL